MALREITYNKQIFPISYTKIPAHLATQHLSTDSTNSINKNIIFLHGWGSNKELMQQAFENVFLEYNHFYIDLPGFGKSPNEILLNTHDYAKIVSAFLDSFKITANVIVGHSYGGKVAILLQNMQQETQDIILLSSAGILTPKPLKIRAKIALAKLAKILHFNLPFLRANDAKGLSPVMYEIFKNIVNEDFSEIFSACKKRTIIFWGNEDKATPIESGYKIHSLITNSKFFACKGGHYFFLTQGKIIQTMYNVMTKNNSARKAMQESKNYIIYHIIVQGNVQGVGYRKFAKAVAKTRDIIGSTQNLANGEVEIYAYGNEESMLDFISELWSGPARANVENLIINPIDEVNWSKQEQIILAFLDSTKSLIESSETKNATQTSHIAESNNLVKSTKLQDFVILRLD